MQDLLLQTMVHDFLRNHVIRSCAELNRQYEVSTTNGDRRLRETQLQVLLELYSCHLDSKASPKATEVNSLFRLLFVSKSKFNYQSAFRLCERCESSTLLPAQVRWEHFWRNKYAISKCWPVILDFFPPFYSQILTFNESHSNTKLYLIHSFEIGLELNSLLTQWN